MKKKTRKIVIALLLATAVAYGDIYVSTNGVDSNSGASWAEAVATIGHAVSIAGIDSTVLVSNGTYNVTAEIVLDAGITVTGVGDREATIVSGSGVGARVFRLTHADAILENVTVTKGGFPAGDLKGAGVYVADGIVRNCIITDNTPADLRAFGAGLYLDAGIVSNCIIRNNYAGQYCRGTGVYNAGGLLVDCVVENNGSMSFSNNFLGGGVYLDGGVVSNCLIRANAVRVGQASGAGVYIADGNLLQSTISDNIIWSASYGRGAGIAMEGGQVANCLVVSNWSNGSSGGGGIMMTGGSVAHSTIAMNRAIGNGIWEGSTTGQAPTGAGIQWGYISGTAGRSTGGGTVTNCIIYNNTRLGSQAQINLGGWGDYTNAFFYCCSRDLTPGVNGNIADDPRFMDPANGDFRLRPDSPCLDAGANLGMTEDVLGQPRSLDGRGDGLAAPDLGAFERQAADSMFQCHFVVTTNEVFGSLDTAITAQVTGPNTNGLYYSWDFGNGTLAGEDLRSVTRSYTELGSYTVTLTVSNVLDEAATWTVPDCIRVGAPIAYVSPDGANLAPYDTWAKAATNIFNAVQAAVVTADGTTRVVVSNGVYSILNSAGSIFIDRGITVTSVNGPAETHIWNKKITEWVYPCLDLDHPDAVIDGFTIGNANMGVCLHQGTVRNCIIRDNSGSSARPEKVEGKGTYGGVGGGIAMYSGLVEQCLIVSNVVNSTRACGAGAFIVGGLMRNCTIAYNNHPGGSLPRGGGVMLFDALNQATLRNCLLLGNEVGTGSHATAGGGGISLQGGRVENCTVVNNQIPKTTTTGSGTGSGIYQIAGTVVNTIMADNTLYFETSDDAVGDLTAYSFSCAPELTAGVDGNISQEPSFVSRATGDYRLAIRSPGINAGTLLDWMTAEASDLDGAPRVVSRKPDMGCYEFIPPPGTQLLLR